MNVEEWRPVIGYEGFYEVSELGRVRRLPQPGVARTPRILRWRHTRKGYVRVTLHLHGRREASVHRLVAEAYFGPAPTPDAEVNHKDGDKLHNTVQNLEWSTPAENRAHAVTNGLMRPATGERQGRAKLNWSAVDTIRASARSVKCLAHTFGVSTFLIRGVQAGSLWRPENRPGDRPVVVQDLPPCEACAGRPRTSQINDDRALALLAEGMTQYQVAAVLGCAQSTVHRAKQRAAAARRSA